MALQRESENLRGCKKTISGRKQRFYWISVWPKMAHLREKNKSTLAAAPPSVGSPLTGDWTGAVRTGMHFLILGFVQAQYEEISQGTPSTSWGVVNHQPQSSLATFAIFRKIFFSSSPHHLASIQPKKRLGSWTSRNVPLPDENNDFSYFDIFKIPEKVVFFCKETLLKYMYDWENTLKRRIRAFSRAGSR